VAVQTVTPEEKETGIEAEKDKLSNWEMSDDPQSLSNILADLNSPEKEIRMAAIQAAVQFESTNAIPVLKAQAAGDNDPDEKAALLQAADYLALPTVTFTEGNAPMPPDLAQQATQRRADSDTTLQAQLQRSAQNSANNSQPAPN
jgi:response regulator RpfG family c-di-GMP phosphodiesterase